MQSVTWSLNIDYPQPFSGMAAWLSIFSFDFLSLECFTGKTDHYQSVLIYTVAPFIMLFAIFGTWGLRRSILYLSDSVIEHELADRLRTEHIYYALIVTYLVLPPVTLRQFQALDCTEYSGEYFIRIDTAISCEDTQFRRFSVLNILALAAYVSILPFWVVTMYKRRHRFNPRTRNLSVKYFVRDNDPSIAPFNFLFAPYRHEVSHFLVTIQPAISFLSPIRTDYLFFPARCIFSRPWKCKLATKCYLVLRPFSNARCSLCSGSGESFSFLCCHL